MIDRNKSEITPQKRSLKLTPVLGDWTTYRPPRTLVKKVKMGLYGFDRLSEDELAQAHMMHYNFGQKFCASLKSKLHAGTELLQVDAYQNTYANFLKTFTMQIMQGRFVCSNYHEDIFFSFDMSLVDSLINASLGSQEASKLGGRLSKAEEIVMDTIFEEHLSGFLDIYKPILQNLKYEKVGSPDIIQDNSMNPQSTFVYFTIEVNINNAIGKIIIGYNGAFIKNLIKKLNSTERKAPLPMAKLPASIFNSVDQEVVVNLGITSLTMNEIRHLEIGDVVSFDLGIDNAIPISLDGHIILGQAGKKEGRFAVKVVAVEKEASLKIAPPAFEEPEKELEESLEHETIDSPISDFSSDDFDKFNSELSDEKIDENLEELPEEEFSEEDLEGSLNEDAEVAQDEESEEPTL